MFIGLLWLLIISGFLSDPSSKQSSLIIEDEIKKRENEEPILMASIVQYDSFPELEDTFESRRNRIENLCSALEHNINSTFQKAVSNLIIDSWVPNIFDNNNKNTRVNFFSKINREHSLTWCPIYKSASSMWMKNFAILGGFPKNLTLKNKSHLDYSLVVKQKFKQTDNFEQKLEVKIRNVIN